MKKLLIISQYYFPENFRINEISNEISNQNWDVTVLTGIPNYPKGIFYKGYSYFKKRNEIIGKVKVIRIPIIPRLNNVFFIFLNYISFVISGYIWVLFNKKRFDLVYCYETSPITQCLPGILLSKFQNINFILYLTDLWPESFVFASRIKKGIVISIINSIVKYIYNNSSLILISSNYFLKQNLLSKVPESKIRYWPQFAESIYKPINDEVHHKILGSDYFNLTYTGNIGYAQDFQVLINAVKLLKIDNISIRVNIFGEGRYSKKFVRLVEKEHLNDYFKFFGVIPSFEIPKILRESDAAFISLKNEEVFELTIPSKLQTYLACGSPIISSINGVTSEIINSSQCGFSSPAGDANKLYKNIKLFIENKQFYLEKFRLNSLNYSKTNFDKNLLLSKLNQFFILEL
jgi:glycosyltransferase involved in cell wall biosynthesis